MSDVLLLRYRDLVADVETIQAHNAIATANGSVLWGWWKKPPELAPDPAMTMLAREIEEHPGVAFLINSADRSLYRAPLHKIFYQPGASECGPPIPEECPQYYRAKKLPAWFQLGPINKVSSDVLNEYVFSSSNRFAFRATISAIQRGHIGQIVNDVDFLDSNVSLWFISRTADIDYSERIAVVRSISRGVWPVKGRYALHLSDLHFGDQHVYRNELTSAPRYSKETLTEALLRDLEALDISFDEIALLFLTGDLTCCGDSHEFANALELIKKLINAFGLHVSQVVVVPGNHDIEWREGKGDIDPNAELNFATFSKQLYGTEPEDTFLRIHQYQIGNRPVCVIGLNSCRLESRADAGLGFVGRQQLDDTFRFLKERPSGDHQLRLALIHHHLLPVNYVEGIDSETKRTSITLDGEAVMRGLICAKVRAVFHGHQHQPYISEIRRFILDYANPLWVDGETNGLDGTLAVIGGGSIGVQRAYLNMVGRNTYNLIEFGDRNELTVRTRVQSAVGPGFSDYQTFQLTT